MVIIIGDGGERPQSAAAKVEGLARPKCSSREPQVGGAARMSEHARTNGSLMVRLDLTDGKIRDSICEFRSRREER